MTTTSSRLRAPGALQSGTQASGFGFLEWMFLLGAVFIILAPLSMSGQATGTIKWARVLTSCLLVVSAFASNTSIFTGPAAWALILYSGFFTLSGAWSSLPESAVAYKALFPIAAIAGIAVASACRSENDLNRGLRLWMYAALLASAAALYQYVSGGSGERLIVNARLAIAGINANNLGFTAAPLFLMLLYGGLTVRRPIERLACIAGCAICVFILLGTGSRGSLLMTLVGGAVLLVFVIKGRSKGLILVLTVGLASYYLYNLLGEDAIGESTDLGVDRLQEDLTKDTRSGIWGYAWRKFMQEPILGHGWIHWSGRASNLMNIVLQTGAEAGIIGIGFLGYFLFTVLRSYLRAIAFQVEAFGWQLSGLALGASLLASILINGMFESALILGTTALPFYLGFATGLVDRAPILLASRPHSRPMPPVDHRRSSRRMSSHRPV